MRDLHARKELLCPLKLLVTTQISDWFETRVWTDCFFKQDLVWREDPDPDGGQNFIGWTLPLLPIAPDLLLYDPTKERWFWYEYETKAIHLLSLPKDISEEEWKAEVNPAFIHNKVKRNCYFAAVQCRCRSALRLSYMLPVCRERRLQNPAVTNPIRERKK